MEKNKTLQALKKVMNGIDETKESLLILHFDWERNHLAMSIGGDDQGLVCMVASAFEEFKNNDPVAHALVNGFIVASVVSDGKLMKYAFPKFRDLMKRKMEEEDK